MTGWLIFAATLIVVLPLLVRFIIMFIEFSREKDRLYMELGRAYTEEEKQYYRRKIKHLWKTLIPFHKK